MSTLRHLAPAGAPIRASDLVRWAGSTLSSTDVASELKHVIRQRFGVASVALTSTGRAGLTLLLRAMRRLAPTHRDEVVVPAYTCYSVAASVVKAGLRVRLVDISPRTLDYAPTALAATDFDRVLAMVATNLYGLPNDLPALDDLSRRRGVFLIDDAAQAMGAMVGGRHSGTWGDAGLFSFDKGKNVAAIDGGIVVTQSSELAGALEAEMRALPSPGSASVAAGAAKALAYSALLRPWLYGIPARIPQLELGKTIYTTDFPLERPPRPLTALALTMIDRLDEFTGARVANAGRLADAARDVRGLTPIAVHDHARPVYLRWPVLVEPACRSRVLAALQQAGIGATASYPASLADVAGLQASLVRTPAPLAGARCVAAGIVTLPTHPFVRAADVRRCIDVLATSTGVASGLPARQDSTPVCVE